MDPLNPKFTILDPNTPDHNILNRKPCIHTPKRNYRNPSDLILSSPIAEPDSFDTNTSISSDFNPGTQDPRPCNPQSQKPRILNSEALPHEILHSRPQTLCILFHDAVNPAPSICKSWTFNAIETRRDPEPGRLQSWGSVGLGRDSKQRFQGGGLDGRMRDGRG